VTAPPDPRFFARVYEAVRAIPRGRVATYGQVAALVGVPRGARAVGWALRALRGRLATTVPWHRVVAAGGRISLRGGSGPLVQKRRLLAEGVRFAGGRIDLTTCGLSAGRMPRVTKGVRQRAAVWTGTRSI